MNRQLLSNYEIFKLKDLGKAITELLGDGMELPKPDQRRIICAHMKQYLECHGQEVGKWLSMKYTLDNYTLPGDIAIMLDTYKSSDKETSIAKGIPNTTYNNSLISRLGKIVPIVCRYRGKSKLGYRRPQAHCHKFAADYITVYFKYI